MSKTVYKTTGKQSNPSALEKKCDVKENAIIAFLGVSLHGESKNTTNLKTFSLCVPSHVTPPPPPPCRPLPSWLRGYQ
jgi:hypothetical protein